MIVYLTCDGYTVIGTAQHGDDLPAECRRLECERDDGFAVVASYRGRIRADVDGYTEPEQPDPILLALERRFD